MPALPGTGCGNGKPCIYISANNWIPFEDISYKNHHPPAIKSSSWKDEKATLFLMIASFRDKLCPHTLFNLYTKAKYPNRIHVGLVQQNLAEDGDCLKEYCQLMQDAEKDGNNKNKDNTAVSSCPYEQNIRIERKDASLAMGPTWARAIGSTLLRDEEFCMQTDAHMDFVPQWDIKMMKMWADTENEYAVLSTYVTDSSELKHNLDGQKGQNGLFEVPHLCMVTLHASNGLVRNWGTKSCRMLPKPKLTNAIWGAGLSFSKCHAERKVAYDPHTPGIFDGEEFSRSLRYWTWGYDVYTPHRVYVVHDYQVSQADPKHMTWFMNRGSSSSSSSSNSDTNNLQQSADRLKLLMGIPTGDQNHTLALKIQTSKYGLGDRRTLEQAIQFTGVDTINAKILSNRCGNIEYISFLEHPLGVEYIPKYDPLTEAYMDERDEGSIYHPNHLKSLQLKSKLLFFHNNNNNSSSSSSSSGSLETTSHNYLKNKFFSSTISNNNNNNNNHPYHVYNSIFNNNSSPSPFSYAVILFIVFASVTCMVLSYLFKRKWRQPTYYRQKHSIPSNNNGSSSSSNNSSSSSITSPYQQYNRNNNRNENHHNNSNSSSLDNSKYV